MEGQVEAVAQVPMVMRVPPVPMAPQAQVAHRTIQEPIKGNHSLVVVVQFLPTILVTLPNMVEVVDARTEEAEVALSLVLGAAAEAVTAQLLARQRAVVAGHGVSMVLPLMRRAVQVVLAAPLLVVMEMMVLAVTLDVAMVARAVAVA